MPKAIKIIISSSILLTLNVFSEVPVIKANSLNYTAPTLCETLTYPQHYRNPTPSNKHKEIMAFSAQDHSNLTLDEFEKAFSKVYFPYDPSTSALIYTKALTPEKMLKSLQKNIDRIPVSRTKKLERYKDSDAYVIINVERQSCNEYYGIAYSVYEYDALLPKLAVMESLRKKDKDQKARLKAQKENKEKQTAKIKAQKDEIKQNLTLELKTLQADLRKSEQVIEDKKPKKYDVIINRKLPDGTMLGSINGRGLFGIQDYTETITQAGYYSLELQEHPYGEVLTRKLDNGFTESIKIYRVQTIGQLQFEHYIKSQEAVSQINLIEELKSKIKSKKIKIENLK